MREIKFRAWHKKYKKLYEVLHLHKSEHEGLWATCKGVDIIEQKDINIQIQPKDIELMQYTGLKDKNGKEIYEGDILSEKWKFKVEYIVDGFYCTYKQGKKYISRPVSVMLKQREKAGDPLEVIGNIYENPELIDG